MRTHPSSAHCSGFPALQPGDGFSGARPLCPPIPTPAAAPLGCLYRRFWREAASRLRTLPWATSHSLTWLDLTEVASQFGLLALSRSFCHRRIESVRMASLPANR
jgi:hypothetical protein